MNVAASATSSSLRSTSSASFAIVLSTSVRLTWLERSDLRLPHLAERQHPHPLRERHQALLHGSDGIIVVGSASCGCERLLPDLLSGLFPLAAPWFSWTVFGGPIIGPPRRRRHFTTSTGDAASPFDLDRAVQGTFVPPRQIDPSNRPISMRVPLSLALVALLSALACCAGTPPKPPVTPPPSPPSLPPTAAAAPPPAAPDISGIWLGTLQAGAKSPRLQLRIDLAKTPAACSLDSLDPQAIGIPCIGLRVTDTAVTL